MDATQPVNRTDHDTLVRLEVMVNQIGTDIKELKDGITTKLNGHEARLEKHDLRLNKIDVLVESTKPEQTIAEFRVLQQEVHDFKTTAKALWITTGLISGVVVFFLTQVPNLLRLSGVIK